MQVREACKCERFTWKELATGKLARESGPTRGPWWGVVLRLQGVLKPGDQPVRAACRLVRAGDGPLLPPSPTLGRRGKALGGPCPDAGASSGGERGLRTCSSRDRGWARAQTAPSGGPFLRSPVPCGPLSQPDWWLCLGSLPERGPGRRGDAGRAWVTYPRSEVVGRGRLSCCPGVTIHS